MRQLLVSAVAAVCFLAGAEVARADHTHVLILPNGSCAIALSAKSKISPYAEALEIHRLRRLVPRSDTVALERIRQGPTGRRRGGRSAPASFATSERPG